MNRNLVGSTYGRFCIKFPQTVKARWKVSDTGSAHQASSYSVCSLPMGRHIAPLRHIILILSQPVFALTLYCCLLSGDATNTNCIVFGFTRTELEPTIYRTRDKHANHYTTNVVKFILKESYLPSQYSYTLNTYSRQHLYLYTFFLNNNIFLFKILVAFLLQKPNNIYTEMTNMFCI